MPPATSRYERLPVKNTLLEADERERSICVSSQGMTSGQQAFTAMAQSVLQGGEAVPKPRTL